MIVFDASTIVGAVIRRGSIPDRAFRAATERDRIAISAPVWAEYLDVVMRPRLARYVDASLRLELLGVVRRLAIVVEPSLAINDCRDAKDNKYLELALAADAAIVVSSDSDLLVLDPWRSRRILRPSEYLAAVDDVA